MYAVIRFGLRQPSMTPIMPPLETLTVGPKVLYILSSTMDDGSFLPLTATARVIKCGMNIIRYKNAQRFARPLNHDLPNDPLRPDPFRSVSLSSA